MQVATGSILLVLAGLLVIYAIMLSEFRKPARASFVVVLALYFMRVGLRSLVNGGMRRSSITDMAANPTVVLVNAALLLLSCFIAMVELRFTGKGTP